MHFYVHFFSDQNHTIFYLGYDVGGNCNKKKKNCMTIENLKRKLKYEV